MTSPSSHIRSVYIGCSITLISHGTMSPSMGKTGLTGAASQVLSHQGHTGPTHVPRCCLPCVCVWSVPHSSPDRQLNWLCRVTCPLRSVTTCPIVSTSRPLVACQSGAVSTCTPVQSACPCIGGTCVHGRSAHIHTNSTEQRLAPTGGGHMVCVGSLMPKEVDMNMKCYGWAHYHALLLN